MTVHRRAARRAAPPAGPWNRRPEPAKPTLVIPWASPHRWSPDRTGNVQRWRVGFRPRPLGTSGPGTGIRGSSAVPAGAAGTAGSLFRAAGLPGQPGQYGPGGYGPSQPTWQYGPGGYGPSQPTGQYGPGGYGPPQHTGQYGPSGYGPMPPAGPPSHWTTAPPHLLPGTSGRAGRRSTDAAGWWPWSPFRSWSSSA